MQNIPGRFWKKINLEKQIGRVRITCCTSLLISVPVKYWRRNSTYLTNRKKWKNQNVYQKYRLHFFSVSPKLFNLFVFSIFELVVFYFIFLLEAILTVECIPSQAAIYSLKIFSVAVNFLKVKDKDGHILRSDSTQR